MSLKKKKKEERRKGESKREYNARKSGGTLNYRTGKVTHNQPQRTVVSRPQQKSQPQRTSVSKPHIDDVINQSKKLLAQKQPLAQKLQSHIEKPKPEVAVRMLEGLNNAPDFVKRILPSGVRTNLGIEVTPNADETLRSNINKNREELSFKAQNPTLVAPEKLNTIADTKPDKTIRGVGNSLLDRLKSRVEEEKKKPILQRQAEGLVRGPKTVLNVGRKAAETFLPSTTKLFKTSGGLMGEGLAYATDKNVREQYLRGNTDVLPTLSKTTQKDVLQQTTGAGIEQAVLKLFPEALKMKIIGRLGTGALQGAGFAVSNGISEGKSLDEVTEDMKSYGLSGALLNAALPYVGIALKQAVGKNITGEFRAQFGKDYQGLQEGAMELQKHPIGLTTKDVSGGKAGYSDDINENPLIQEAKKEVDSTKWFRGQDKYNTKSGDSFYSASEDVAGDFGKVSPIKNKPKNPLVISSKDELAQKIGFKGDPTTTSEFDSVAKKYAQENGYDSIMYRDGTLGESELHVFKSQPLQEGVSELSPTNKLTTPNGLPEMADTPQLPKTEPQFPTTTKGSGIKPPALDTPGTPEEISYYKKFINWKRGKTTPLREVIEDEWIRVKNLERSGADVSQELTPYETHKLFPGRIAARSKTVQEEVSRIDKDILQTGKKFKAENLNDDVNQYLIAKHAPERNAVHGERAAGMSDDEAQQILTRIKGTPHGKEVERIAKEVQTLNKTTLEVLYDGQVIDKETYDLLNTTYKNHVPLQRVMENDDIVQVLTGKGLSVKGSGIKRAVGSEREVKDILGNVSANLQEALVRAEKNRVNLSTLEFARNNENTGLFEIFKPKAIGRTFDDKIITEKVTDPMVLTARENGKPIHIRIKDPKMAVVYQGLGVQKMPPFFNFVGAFTRLYSGIHTRFNFEFALSNKIRDIQEMAVYISSQKGMGISGAGKAVGRDIVSMAEVTGNSKLYQQMVMDGGTTGGMALSTRQAVELDIASIRKLNRSNPQKGAEMVMRGVDKWNTIFEDSTRLSVYKTALGNGMSRDKAAILAKDATIDFNKKGTGGAVINSIWMFSNASIQGTAKMMRAMKNPKTAAAVVTAVGGATWAVNNWNDKVDPDWRTKATTWDKNNNLVVVLPTNEGTRYVTIPVSWGLKPLKVSADYVYDLANGKDAGVVKSIENLIGSAMDAYNPVGGTDAISAVTPTILDLPFDIARNRSWSGANIKPDWMQGLPKADQYFQSLKNSAVGRTAISATQSISEKTGRAIDISPEDAVYVYEQMIGGAGKALTRLFNTGVGIAKGEDVMPRNVPFLNRFLKTRTEEELQTSQKWEDKEETQQGFRQFKTGSQEQKDAIQKHLLSLPKEDRQKEAFILREEGFDLEGVTQSENVYNLRPKTEQLKKNLSEGNMKDFYDTLDGLSPEEQATFGDIKTSNPEFKGFSPYTKYNDPSDQKRENTRTFHERLMSHPEEGIRFLDKLPAEEKKRQLDLLDNKGNEEWFKKYQEASSQKTSLLNKALGIPTAEAKTVISNNSVNLATVDLSIPRDEPIEPTQETAKEEPITGVIAKQHGAPEQYAGIIGKSAQESGVPEDLLTKLLKQESGFIEEVIRGTRASSAGALGIAQFMPATAKERGIDPLNPDEAIPAAAKYLKELKGEFGSWELALAAYNAGPGNVKKYGGIPPFPETQKYVKTIIGGLPSNEQVSMSGTKTLASATPKKTQVPAMSGDTPLKNLSPEVGNLIRGKKIDELGVEFGPNTPFQLTPKIDSKMREYLYETMPFTDEAKQLFDKKMEIDVSGTTKQGIAGQYFGAPREVFKKSPDKYDQEAFAQGLITKEKFGEKNQGYSTEKGKGVNQIFGNPDLDTAAHESLHAFFMESNFLDSEKNVKDFNLAWNKLNVEDRAWIDSNLNTNPVYKNMNETMRANERLAWMGAWRGLGGLQDIPAAVRKFYAGVFRSIPYKEEDYKKFEDGSWGRKYPMTLEQFLKKIN